MKMTTMTPRHAADMERDPFVAALVRSLASSQRVLPEGTLFCAPVPRSLALGTRVTADDVATHLLLPITSTTADEEEEHAMALDQPGDYATANGRRVRLTGAHVVTVRGFAKDAQAPPRQVRILLSARRELEGQCVTVLRLSRPLEGGLQAPDDPNEMDVATVRRVTAMLRAFPEHELVFRDLDRSAAQVQRICRDPTVARRYTATLPEILQHEWRSAVRALAASSRREDEEEAEAEEHGHDKEERREEALQHQQVVESYLMEPLHDVLLAHEQRAHDLEDTQLATIWWRWRHATPADFGVRKGFQSAQLVARDELQALPAHATPLEMLRALKRCLDAITKGIVEAQAQAWPRGERHEVTTDDILDTLLYVLVQAFVAALDERDHGQEEEEEEEEKKNGEEEHPRVAGLLALASVLPLASVLAYVADFHFVNASTTALGFTLATFQVACEFFLERARHLAACGDACQRRRPCGHADAVAPLRCELARARNHRQWLASTTTTTTTAAATASVSVSLPSTTRLVILGDWSTATTADEEEHEHEDATEDDEEAAEDAETQTTTSMTTSTSTSTRNSAQCHAVVMPGEDEEPLGAITRLACGHRFFACVDEHGTLRTWGDHSGGRLGFSRAHGAPRRAPHPHVVAMGPPRVCVLDVSCGAFHALATDVNGHVFAWGQNAHGQLGRMEPEHEHPVPTPVDALRGTYMRGVACGAYHSLALSADGRVFSWGSNQRSQLGRRTPTPVSAATPQPLVLRHPSHSHSQVRSHSHSHDHGHRPVIVRRIAAGRSHSVALTCRGTAFTWGRGDAGQLGLGGAMDAPEPRPVVALAWTARHRLRDPHETDDHTHSQLFPVGGPEQEEHEDDADPETDDDHEDVGMVAECGAGAAFTLFVLRDGAVLATGQDPTQISRRHRRPPPSSASSAASTREDTEVDDVPTLLRLPLELRGDAIVRVACGDTHFALLSASGGVWQSTTIIDHEREPEEQEEEQEENTGWRVRRVLELPAATQIAAGASHTLVLAAASLS